MRILLITNPLYGHLNPMLPVARAARRAGHEVVVAAAADIAPLAQGEGLATWPVGMTHAEGGGNVQASWLAYFEAGARARIADLLPRCEAWRPDWVIHEETELAGPVVAAMLGARSLVHGLGPHPPMRLLPWFSEAIGRLSPAGTGLRVLDAWRAATYLCPCPPGLRPADEVIWRDARTLRPETPGEDGDVALMRRIDQLPHTRNVFVTLGTVYGGNVAALAAAIEGLRRLEVNLIVAAGPQGDPGLLQAGHEAVLVERFVPLARVLRRCVAVVSQGGSGVMLGAMARGLPQLMLPQGADQFRNAEAAARTGAALAISPDAANAQAIGDAARRLLHEGCFTAAARGLRDEIAAMPDADTVIAALAARD